MNKKTIEFILDGVIVAVVLVLGIMFALRYLPNGSQLTPDVVAAHFKQYTASEAVFKTRYTNYQGSCQDLALPANVRCVATPTTYKLEQTLSDGSAYCADSTGFTGQLSAPTSPTATLCH